MIILHANDATSANKINKYIDDGCDVFMLIYMEGCGPCNAVRPEWSELQETLGQQYAKNNKLVIVDVNKDFANLIKKINQPDGFPTMIYTSQRGSKIENYEDSSITDKSRNVDCFIDWVESSVSKMKATSPASTHLDVYKRILHKNKTHKKRSLRNTNSKKKSYKNKRKSKPNSYKSKYSKKIQ